MADHFCLELRSPEDMTRRGVIAGFAGLVATSLVGPVAKARSAGDVQAIVPTLIFFPELRRTPRTQRPEIRVQDLGEDSADLISVLFSNGEVLSFLADAASSRLRMQSGALTALRLKSLAAWLFDAYWRALRRSCGKEHYESLKKDFARLQTQDVLEKVTARSLFLLTERLNAADAVRSVKWSGARFDVS